MSPEQRRGALEIAAKVGAATAIAADMFRSAVETSQRCTKTASHGVEMMKIGDHTSDLAEGLVE